MVIIRKAKREDAKAAWDIRNAAILNQCVGYYPIDDLEIWTSGELSQRFTDAVEKHFHVATDNNQVIGTGMVNLETGKIDAMFVHPNYMAMGVGRTIIKYLENLARGEGLNQLCLEATLNAARFYRACGFEGDKVGKYESPTGVLLDCIPMVKVLAPNIAFERDAPKAARPST